MGRWLTLRSAPTAQDRARIERLAKQPKLHQKQIQGASNLTLTRPDIIEPQIFALRASFVSCTCDSKITGNWFGPSWDGCPGSWLQPAPGPESHPGRCHGTRFLINNGNVPFLFLSGDAFHSAGCVKQICQSGRSVRWWGLSRALRLVRD